MGGVVLMYKIVGIFYLPIVLGMVIGEVNQSFLDGFIAYWIGCLLSVSWFVIWLVNFDDEEGPE